jgi:hypothetical protein
MNYFARRLLLGTVCIASFDRDNFWITGISGISQDARKRVSHSSNSSAKLLNGRAHIEFGPKPSIADHNVRLH